MTTTQVAERSRIAAIVLAGGLGNRMGDSIDVPKQFYLLNGKPILIHTLEVFERHPEVDIVCVVCLAGREEYLRESLERFGIRKVGPIVTAGEVRQGSVYNGLKALEGVCRPDDIVIVHDGVRMFIFPELITEIINAVDRKSVV